MCAVCGLLLTASARGQQAASPPAAPLPLPAPSAGLPALPPPTRLPPLPAPVVQAQALAPIPEPAPDATTSPEPAEAQGFLPQLSLARTAEGLTIASPPTTASAPAGPAVAPAKPAPTYPTVIINGAFQADAGWFSQDAASLATFGRLENGADFRRARLSAKGAITENMNYMAQVDFAFFGRPTIMDMWVESTDLPVLGNLRVGNWKQPFSLEVVSSYRYTTFMERSTLFQAFTPFRHLGTGFFDHADDEMSTWAASVFAAGNDQYAGSAARIGGIAGAARLTRLAYYDEPSEGRYYLHLGLADYVSNPLDHLARFRSIPEMFIGDVLPGELGTSLQPVPGTRQDGTPFFVDTFAVRASVFNVLGTELLWVNGPFSLQSEVMVTAVDHRDGPTAVLEGGYAQVGYFLTGEHRPYDRKLGCIERIKPFENFFIVNTADGVRRGSGAWEVAFRYSYIDLNDAGIRGGTLSDTTLGLNWYLNPYCKLVANWVHAFLDDRNGINSDTDLFGIRCQVDF